MSILCFVSTGMYQQQQKDSTSLSLHVHPYFSDFYLCCDCVVAIYSEKADIVNIVSTPI